jgi:hypothetical protein
VGETLAETRVEVGEQRADIERTADQLRDALDLRRRFAENPAAFLALGGAAIFLIVGGPIRVARLLRRRVMRSQPEKAYDTLPKPLQRVVDELAGAVGPRAADARQALSEELQRWRHDPRAHRRMSRKLAKELAEGPPGPGRATWRALEAGATMLSGALARRAIERFLSSETTGEATTASAPTAPPSTPSRGGAEGGYSSLSSRSSDR